LQVAADDVDGDAPNLREVLAKPRHPTYGYHYI
jgi:hypothetical protein